MYLMSLNLGKVINLILTTIAISSLLVVNSALAQVNVGESTRVIVQFREPVTSQDKAFVLGLGGSISHQYSLVPAMAIAIPTQAIKGLERNPRVVLIEEDVEVQAVHFDDEYLETWSINNIKAKPVHENGNKGAGVKVGIIDSGIDYTHPDLKENYVTGKNFISRGKTSSDPMDVYGHGTHVAGTVCASMNSWGAVGVAPSCELYALKVLNDNGSGQTSDILASIEWAVERGLDVVNLSLGSSGNPGATAEAVYQAAYDAGLVIVAAAGNSGTTDTSAVNTIWPANYASVIAVAATDQNDNRAWFSSTGPNVEIAAPGLAVHSTWNDSDSPSNPQPVCDTGTRGCYKDASGTSMASPQVAGVAALIIGTGLVTDTNGNGRINDEVRATMNATAVDLGTSGKDNVYGHGLVDASAAVASLLPSGLQAPVAHAGADQTLTDADNSGSELVTLDASASFDLDGSIISYEWDINGDAITDATGVTISVPLNIGTHIVTLTVTDDDSQTDTDEVIITINPYVEELLTLSATGYKVKGSQKVDLTWSGASSNVDIYRNGTIVISNTVNDGLETDHINLKGSGSYTYKICEYGSITSCSSEILVSF